MKSLGLSLFKNFIFSFLFCISLDFLEGNASKHSLFLSLKSWHTLNFASKIAFSPFPSLSPGSVKPTRIIKIFGVRLYEMYFVSKKVMESSQKPTSGRFTDRVAKCEEETLPDRGITNGSQMCPSHWVSQTPTGAAHTWVCGGHQTAASSQEAASCIYTSMLHKLCVPVNYTF